MIVSIPVKLTVCFGAQLTAISVDDLRREISTIRVGGVAELDRYGCARIQFFQTSASTL